jgi:hypothetical protein
MDYGVHLNPFFFVLVGLAAVTLFIYLKNKKIQTSLEATAKALGFEFIKEGSKGIETEIQKNGTATSGPLGNFLKTVMKFLSSWEIRGTVDSGKILIFEEFRGAHYSKVHYTIIDLIPNSPLPFSLEMYRKGFFTTIGIQVFQMQDIIVGDEKFDKLLRVMGNDEKQIKSFLSDKSKRDAIIDLFNHGDFIIYHDKMRFEYMGQLHKVEEIKPHIDKMNIAANKIYSTPFSSF